MPLRAATVHSVRVCAQRGRPKPALCSRRMPTPVTSRGLGRRRRCGGRITPSGRKANSGRCAAAPSCDAARVGSGAPQSEQRPTSRIELSSSSFPPAVISGVGADVVRTGLASPCDASLREPRTCLATCDDFHSHVATLAQTIMAALEFTAFEARGEFLHRVPDLR
jgi:hypothetical protein